MIKWKTEQNIFGNFFLFFHLHILSQEQLFFCSILHHRLIFYQCRYYRNCIKMAVGTGPVFESVFSAENWSFAVSFLLPLHEDIKYSRTAKVGGNYQCLKCCFFPHFFIGFSLTFSFQKKKKKNKKKASFFPFFYNPSIVSCLI